MLPALRRLRQGDFESKVRLCVETPLSNNNTVFLFLGF